MSTLLGQNDSRIISSEKDLTGYFESFAKLPARRRVGLEAEFFAVDARTGQALPYDGDTGIRALLNELALRFHYERVMEGLNIIALTRGDWVISLEPGGQMELSAPPVLDAFEIEKQIRQFLEELLSLKDCFPTAAWLAVGMQPFSSLDEISWVPKRRYRLMADYMATHGAQSHEMMKRTATNQICVDYTSEQDAMAGLRTALGITSIVTAMFAHSPFTEGRPNGFLTRRLDIWNHTAPERSGLIVSFTEPGKTFRDYCEYLLQMPMMFIVRASTWRPVKNLTFRQFIREGYQGEKATLADFELHLSTAFPEVRIKQYLEIRGMDCQRPEMIPALAAFWKGILYHEETREKAWQLVAFATEQERLALHYAVPKEGLKAQLGGRPILAIARELVELSCASLAIQKSAAGKPSECVYLDKIREQITGPGRTPAEELLEKWNGSWEGNPRHLIESLQIKRVPGDFLS